MTDTEQEFKPLLYFAYGSNMSLEVMSKLEGNFKPIDSFQLFDFRLAFTRKKQKSGKGAADIIPSKGNKVWGVLYEIDYLCQKALDKKEGLGRAYERIEVDVTRRGQSLQAYTYTVIEKHFPELHPGDDYLQTMVTGAVQNKLPKAYVNFLEAIRQNVEGQEFRSGFFATSTQDRSMARGISLVKLSTEWVKEFPNNRLVSVQRNNKSVLAAIAHDSSINPKECELDQSIRNVLGINGKRLSYGQTIVLMSTDIKNRKFRLFSPRTLVLSVLRPPLADSEKQICVLHPNNIKLLGIEEGDYIRITTCSFNENREVQKNTLVRRVYGGSQNTVHYYGEHVEYPSIQNLYVDYDGRQVLDIHRDHLKTAVLIEPAIGRLFLSKILYYGIAIFLSFIALIDPINDVADQMNAHPLFATVISVGIATLASLTVVVYDIRSKIHY